MSNEKQKDPSLEKPKTGQGSESQELDNEALDGVSGGMGGLRTTLPTTGPVVLPGDETVKCISQ